jgi:hypothetical protein
MVYRFLPHSVLIKEEPFLLSHVPSLRIPGPISINADGDDDDDSDDDDSDDDDDTDNNDDSDDKDKKSNKLSHSLRSYLRFTHYF